MEWLFWLLMGIGIGIILGVIFMNLYLTINDFCKRPLSPCPKLYPVFGFGLVREQGKEPVVRTPQFFSSRKGRILFMAKLTATQQAPITVDFKDKKGNVAQPDGVPEWFTDNTDVLSLTSAADGLSCVAAAVGPLGTATVTMRADAKMGTEVQEVIGTLQIDVGPGDATVVNLNLGAPTEQP